jgi:uncharacterized protein YbcC (UPF0753/DUF2309 family)
VNYPDQSKNPARQALTRTVNKAIADGAPVYINQPAIEYQMDAQGGFYAADTYRKTIEYAYPSSEHARLAVKNPARVADEMLAGPAIHYADRWEYMRGKMLKAKGESPCE